MRKLNKLLAVLVCMAMAAALLPAMTVTAAAPVIEPVKPTGGDGTKKDPYEIGTAAELYWFADQVNTGHGNISVVLTDDIEINKNVVDADGSLIGSGDDYVPWVSMGKSDSAKYFTGTFDGRDHEITGLYMKGNFGLFGYTGERAVIKNVSVGKSYFNGNGGYNGGAICFSNKGLIENCKNSNTISGTGSIGGICYSNTGVIESCVNTGDISKSTSGYYVGGICGDNSGEVKNCRNVGKISRTGGSGYNYIGGIVGRGGAEGCVNDGDIEVGSHTYAGGISGYLYNYKVVDCVNSGVITATGSSSVFIGGIAGYGSYSSNSYSSTVESCVNYADLSITNKDIYLGGILGYGYSKDLVMNSCNLGALSCDNASEWPYVGGIIGLGFSTTKASHCYYLGNEEAPLDPLKAIGTGGADENSESKTAEQFAGGEVAVQLNGGVSGGSVWFQNLGDDPGPVRDETHGVVYAGYEHNGTEFIYSNSPLHEEPGDHDSYFDAGGTCSVCGKRRKPVEDVTLDQNNVTVEVGKTLALTATVYPNDATDKKVSWTTDREAIAKVDGGVVTGVSPGTAIITATTDDGGKTAFCNVRVIAALEITVPVAGVTLDANKITVSKNGTHKLTANVTPAEATNKKVNWMSSDPTVATVRDGMVTGVSSGVAAIVVSTEDGGKTAMCTVLVDPDPEPVAPVPVTGMTLDVNTITITKNGTHKLTANVTPAEATNKKVNWMSSNPTVATVQDGTVTGVSSGEAVIIATTEDGGKTAVCTVLVDPAPEPVAPVPVTGLTLGENTITVSKNGTHKLTANVTPAEATNKKVNWLSSDPTVATVQDGTVTGVSSGEAVIIATTEDGGKTAVCTVLVDPAPEPVAPVPVTGVTLGENTITVSKNGTHRLTANVTPAEATNKKVNWMSSNPTVSTVQDGTVTGVSSGEAVIIATTEDGGKTAVCTVLVDPAPEPVAPVPVTGVTLGENTITVSKNGTHRLTANVTPAEATNKKVNWLSSDPTVATVQDGTVTGVSSGVAVVIAATEDGGKTAVCTVLVDPAPEPVAPVPVTGLTLNAEAVTMNAGEIHNLTANVTPAEATNKTVNWLSTDPSVAVVQSGMVVGIAPGVAAVVAVTEDGGKTAVCTVTVNPAPGPENPRLYTVNSLSVADKGGYSQVSANVTNNSVRKDKDVIVIAVYKDNALVDMVFMDAAFDKGQTVDFGGRLTAVKGAVIKAFVWDDLDSMTPLSNTVEKAQ